MRFTRSESSPLLCFVLCLVACCPVGAWAQPESGLKLDDGQGAYAHKAYRNLFA